MSEPLLSEEQLSSLTGGCNNTNQRTSDLTRRAGRFEDNPYPLHRMRLAEAFYSGLPLECSFR